MQKSGAAGYSARWIQVIRIKNTGWCIALPVFCVMGQIDPVDGDGRINQFGIRSGDREEFRFSAVHTDMHPLTLDCLDPSVFPGTGISEAGGISFLQLLTAIRMAARCKIVGADVNEFASMLDPSGVFTATACKVLRELLLVILKK